MTISTIIGSIMLIEKSRALEILRPYQDIFIEAIFSAWDDYMEGVSPACRAKFDLTASANAVHSCIRHRFKAMEGTLGLRFPVAQEPFFLIVVEEKLLMKVKKLSRRHGLVSRNVKTSQTKQFRRHENLSLQGVAELAHLEIGYEPDGFGQKIESVWLICPNGESRNFWHESLWGTESAPENIEAFPQPQVPSDPHKRYTEKKFTYNQERDEEEGK